MNASLIQLTIDDKPVAVPPGTNLIEAAKSVGVEIPHYCYHPRLPVAGNCRMCLVEVGMPKLGPDKKPELTPDGKPVIAFQPKLAIGCNTPVAPGMVVRTRSPKTIKARQGVMEFLLVNHPLDCPICDQAGECRLQEFAEDYGRGFSRFVEEKNHKPKQVPLGPKIMLDVERCIMCTRCERFMRHVAGQDVLGFSKRGSRVELTIYPGEWPDTNYDLNIVDICPVGALTSTDFRFRQRVWFLKQTKSICTGCSTGCNVVLWSREGVVHRLTPRENDAVNQSWMCDQGRTTYRKTNDAARLKNPTRHNRLNGQVESVTWADAIPAVARRLSELRAAGAGVAAIGSAGSSTEELFLLNVLSRGLMGAELTDVVPRSGPGDAFLYGKDRNPNTNGAVLMRIAAGQGGGAIPLIASAIQNGRVKALIVVGEDVTTCGLGPELLAKLEFLLVIDALPGGTTAVADYVLPGATFAEKRGTFVNSKWRMQRFAPAFVPANEARPDWMTLAAVIRALDPRQDLKTVEDVFAAMTVALPALAGLSFAKLGDLGVVLDEQQIGKEASEKPAALSAARQG